MTERLSPAVAHGQAPSSYNLSVSLRSTAPLVGEPLAKPFTLRGLPKPPLVGEPLAERKTLNWEGKLCGMPKPPLWGSWRGAPERAHPGSGTASAVTERLFPDLFREFVENARLKRKEFVNVIKMRRRY